tara:strand:- start:15122 stop:15385 length:264 start_codon:yes stop_codon:yes gene_type:complete
VTISAEVNVYINKFKTKHKQGFIPSECEHVIEYFKSKYKFNMDKYYKAMYGNTCMVIDGEIITYQCDITLGIKCGIENREQTVEEWD